MILKIDLTELLNDYTEYPTGKSFKDVVIGEIINEVRLRFDMAMRTAIEDIVTDSLGLSYKRYGKNILNDVLDEVASEKIIEDKIKEKVETTLKGNLNDILDKTIQNIIKERMDDIEDNVVEGINNTLQSVVSKYKVI